VRARAPAARALRGGGSPLTPRRAATPPPLRARQDVRWHDARDAELATLDLGAPALVGLILTAPSADWLGRLLGGRHWLALRRLGGAWWNLDSDLDAPAAFEPASGAGGGGQQAGGSGGGQEAGGGDGGQEAGVSSSDNGSGALRAFLADALARGGELMIVTTQAEAAAEEYSGDVGGGGAGAQQAAAASGGEQGG
jgi:hypothetical protein